MMPMPMPSHRSIKRRVSTTYLGAGDSHLNLAAGSAHQLAKLGANLGQEAEAVVLGQNLEQVLDGGAAGARRLLELSNDGALVGGSQGRGDEDGGKLGVLLDQLLELGQAAGGRLERLGLDGRGVLLFVRHSLSA